MTNIVPSNNWLHKQEELIFINKNGEEETVLVDYFTNKLTGEAGMSQTGLAVSAGITPKALRVLEQDLLGNKSRSKWLEPLLGKEFRLGTSLKKGNADVVVYNSEFCSRVIKHYAFETGSKTAQESLDAMEDGGMKAMIYAKTGFIQQAPQNQLDGDDWTDPLLASMQSMVELRKRQLEQDRKTQILESRLDSIEQELDRDDEVIAALPEATEEVEELTTQAALNRFMRGRFHKPNTIQNAWGELYKEYYYRNGCNLPIKKRNAVAKGEVKKSISTIEYAAKLDEETANTKHPTNHVNKLYALALELWGGE